MQLLMIFLIFTTAAWNDRYLQEINTSFQQIPELHTSHCKTSAGFVSAPLMVAIWHGDIETVKKLVTPETDLNVFYKLERQDGPTPPITPLLYAIEAKNAYYGCLNSEEIVEFLLDHKANPNFFTAGDMSPLQMAATLGDVSITKILLKRGTPVDYRNTNGETALLIAAQRKNGTAVIKELMEAGADIHAVNKFGDNALMLAAWKHQPETVKLLVELGIDPCLKNKEGETALDQAVSYSYDEPGRRDVIALLQQKCGP